MAPTKFSISLSDSLLSQVSQFARGLTLTDPDKAQGFTMADGSVNLPAVLAYLTGPGTYLVSRPLALNKRRAVELCAAGKVSPAAYAAVYGEAGTRNSHRPVKAPKAPKAQPPAASPTFDPLAATPSAPAPVNGTETLRALDAQYDALQTPGAHIPPALPVKAPRPVKAPAPVKAPKPPTKRKAPKADTLPPHAKGCTCRTCKPAPAASGLTLV